MNRRRALGLVALGLVRASAAARAAPPGRACEQNLRVLRDAVLAFRRTRGELPMTLSELAHGGLIDPLLLLCPLQRDSGAMRVAVGERNHSLSNDPLTHYHWMFSASEVALGGQLSQRDHRLRQKQIGLEDSIPLVRCPHHISKDGRNWLTLTLGGTLFRSGEKWEEEVRHIVPFPYLNSSALIGVSVPVPLSERIPPRSVAAQAKHFDLGPAFNAALHDPWAQGYDGEAAKDLLALGGSTSIWAPDRVTFELRGIVQVEGRAARSFDPDEKAKLYPSAARPISFNVETGTLHVLAGVIKQQTTGTEAAVLRITADDGSTYELSLRHGIHVAHGDAVAGPDAAVVWSRTKTTKHDTGARSVSHVTWRLPRRMRIRRLEFRACEGEDYPFLLAVTAE